MVVNWRESCVFNLLLLNLSKYTLTLLQNTRTLLLVYLSVLSLMVTLSVDKIPTVVLTLGLKRTVTCKSF